MFEFQSVCISSSGNKRCPPIGTTDGTHYHTKVVILHHINPSHLACLAAKFNQNLSLLSVHQREWVILKLRQKFW